MTSSNLNFGRLSYKGTGMISSRNSMTKDDEFILGNRQLANHALDDRLSLKSSLTQHYGEYSGQQVQSSYSKQIVDSRYFF